MTECDHPNSHLQIPPAKQHRAHLAALILHNGSKITRDAMVKANSHCNLMKWICSLHNSENHYEPTENWKGCYDIPTNKSYQNNPLQGSIAWLCVLMYWEVTIYKIKAVRDQGGKVGWIRSLWGEKEEEDEEVSWQCDSVRNLSQLMAVQCKIKPSKSSEGSAAAATQSQLSEFMEATALFIICIITDLH